MDRLRDRQGLAPGATAPQTDADWSRTFHTQLNHADGCDPVPTTALRNVDRFCCRIRRLPSYIHKADELDLVLRSSATSYPMPIAFHNVYIPTYNPQSRKVVSLAKPNE